MEVVAHLVAIATAQAIAPLHVRILVLLDVVDVPQVVPLHVPVLVHLDVVVVLQIVQEYVLAFVHQVVLLTVLAHVGDAGEDVEIAIKINRGF